MTFGGRNLAAFPAPRVFDGEIRSPFGKRALAGAGHLRQDLDAITGGRRLRHRVAVAAVETTRDAPLGTVA